MNGFQGRSQAAGRLRRTLAAAGASLLLSTGAAAQGLATSPCPPGSTSLGFPDAERAAQDACTQAYDVFQLLAPQLALALAGGNAVLGQGGALGGPGRFSVGLRVNLARGLLPDVVRFQQSFQGAERRELPTLQQVIGLPTADAAVGLFPGLSAGGLRVGGVDALISASYVPTLEVDGVSITPANNLQLGYGARVGVVEEGIAWPGVALTFLRRDLPETDIVGTSGGNTLRVSRARTETTAWRVVAGKSWLGLLAVAAGVGRDRYRSRADVSATVTGAFSGTTSVPGTSQSLARTNLFLDAGLRLAGVRLVGELGRVSGGAVETFNAFEGNSAARAMTYLSFAVQLAR